MRALPLTTLVLAAALATGCATGPNAGRTGTASGEPNGATGLCMFDRRGGGVRRCLNFTFGKCNLFGDVCTSEEIEAQRTSTGLAVEPEAPATPQ